MRSTKIEWTQRTWNPITGCTKASPGCRNCYAEIMSYRLQAMGNPKYANGFSPTTHPEELQIPITWKQPALIFVCSMSDLFHKSIPFGFIDRIFKTIQATPQHTYQILTKRPERMFLYFRRRSIPENVWLGATIEGRDQVNRLEYLKKIAACTKFISFEPLISDIGKIDLSGIDWVIVGGESGPKARPMEKNWVLSIKQQAQKLNIPFFFKQWGTWGADKIRRNKKANGRLLNGKTYSGMPRQII